MRVLLIAGAAGLMTYALPTLAQMAGGPAAEWGRSVTRTQAQQEASAKFALADTNKDGFVTPEELRGAAETRMAEHRNMAFDRMDADHNGAISRDEFSARRAAPDQQMMVQRFEGPGPDGTKDGKGRHREMRIMMMRHGGPGGGSMMMMADTDHDGRISQAEAVGGALKMFDNADANHDGTVTPQERAGAMRAWGDKMRMRGGPMGDMPPPPPPPAG